MTRTLHMLTAALLALALLWLVGAYGNTNTVTALPASTIKIFVAIDAGNALADATLYSLDPDGSGQTKLFDFHDHPADGRGSITDLRAGSDGYIYFASDNAYLFTPANRNLFRLRMDGTDLDPITASAWNQPCPCGSVSGIVRRSNGDPWSNAPVFLDGRGTVNSGADGRFYFDNVPVGARWIVAYRPGDSNSYDAEAVTVQAGLTMDVQLSPNSRGRMNYERPVRSGQRIYYRFYPNSIQWTNTAFSTAHEVYKTSGLCTGIADVDGFDVGPVSGRLAIANYQEGCGTGDTEHRGVYVAGEDGGNLRLLIDMMADPNWCGVQEVFWSPDESKMAVKACYQWRTYLVVFDAANGNVLGSAYFNDQSYTLYNVGLHGWSPGGEWLLYSFWLNDPGAGVLAKMPVNSDGRLDAVNAVALLSNTRITGATWGRLDAGQSRHPLYLPLITS